MLLCDWILKIYAKKKKNTSLCVKYKVPTHKNLEQCATPSYNLSA